MQFTEAMANIICNIDLKQNQLAYDDVDGFHEVKSSGRLWRTLKTMICGGREQEESDFQMVRKASRIRLDLSWA